MVSKYNLCHYDPYLMFTLDKLWHTLKSDGLQKKTLLIETFQRKGQKENAT